MIDQIGRRHQTLHQTEIPCAVRTDISAVSPGSSIRRENMALFMDVHTIDGGVAPADVAAAHAADLVTQGDFGVHYLRYWLDAEAGKIFCLVDAPDAEAANTVHRKAHGLVADEIYPVTEHA